jgi:exosortase/archaeosortase family protein
VWGLILAGGFMAFTAWDQSYWWRIREDYSYGWLVPLFIAYLVYDRWPKVVAQARAVDRGSDDLPDERSGSARLIPVAAFLSLIGGGALFLSGAFLRPMAGVTHLNTLTITLGMTGTVLATVYFLAPTNADLPGSRVNDRRKMVSLFLFPTALWLLSAPMLSVIENHLSLFLMHQVTSIVFFVFDRLGLALEQRGNVLILPTGSVGVAEACSGIRSLTGCLFAGSFLAAVFLQSRWKQAALVIAALLFAFAANLLRSIFLTSWAYRHGAGSIEGTIHDISGYAVLGLTVVALLCLLPILDRKPVSQRPAVSAKG